MRHDRCAALPVVALAAALALAWTLAPAAAPKRKLLYLNHSAGFKHQTAATSGPIVQEIGEKSGAFAATVTDDCGALTAENLKQYDAVLFYTTGELPVSDQQKQALLDFVRSGKGFAGIHSATDTFCKWPEYGELIGGYFDKHPWHQDVRVRVEDGKHPATRHLGEAFTIKDEIYQFRNWSRDKVHVLLSLDPASVDLNAKDVHRTDKDFAIAWTRQYGKGRVFYTALGHRAEVWADERYQTHLLNGLRWVMKDR
jgi:hypothetical protein